MQAGRRSRLSLGGEHLQRAMAPPDDAARRKTIVGEIGAANKENATADDPVPANTPAPGEKATSTTTTTASHMKSLNRHHHHQHRLKLPGSVSAYYFAGVPETPLGKEFSAKKKQFKSPGKALSAKKKLDAALLDESDAASNGIMLDESFDNSKFARYDGSVGAAETSFLSAASSSTGAASSSSSSGDMLNQSILSDTTELTPANFILQARSRQFIQSNNKHARDAADAAARSSKAANQPAAASHQDKDSTEAVAMEVAEMAVEPEAPPRPPLPVATGKDRRKTLATTPGGFFQLTQASEMDDTPLSTRSRRETLHGPIPGGSTAKTDKKASEMSKQALRLAANMREKREKRQKDRDSEVRERLSTGSTMSLDIPQSLLGGPRQSADDCSTTELSLSRMRAKERIDDDNSTALDLPASLLAAVTKDGTNKPSDDNDDPIADDASTALELPASLLAAVAKPGQKRSSDDSSTNSATLELPESLLGAGTKPTATRTVIDDSSTMELRPSLEIPFLENGVRPEGDTDSMNLSFGSLFDDLTENPVAGRASEIEERDVSNNMNTTKDAQSKRNEPDENGPKAVPGSISFNPSVSSISKRSSTTPTRLKGSPRRISQNNLVNSSAQDTAVPSNTLGSPAQKKNKHADASGLVASPVQNTRPKSTQTTPDSKKRKHVPPDGSDSPVDKELLDDPGSDLKRHKSSAFAEVGKKLHGAPQSSKMFKPPGSARKTVIFGSPDAAVYNEGSPPTSMTPMLHSRAKARFPMPDDTAEIEADMNAMFQNGRLSQQTNNILRDVASKVDLAANVQKGLPEGMQSYDNSDMELDSSSNSSSDGLVGDNDPTEELETCMADLLNGVGGKKVRKDPVRELKSIMEDTLNGADKQQESVDEPDQTEELESNLVDILKGGTVGNEREGVVESDRTQQLESNLADLLNVTGDTNQSKRLENEQTEELEDNLEDVLDSTDDHRVAQVVHTNIDDTTRELECNMRDILESDDSPQPPGSKTRRRRSRKTSRRFSICPKSRLSLSADGSVLDSSGMCLDVTGGESDLGMPAVQPEEIAPVLDLKVEEVLAVAGTLGNLNPLGDILVEIGESIRDCATADVIGTMNDCLKSVCEKVESTIPEIDPHLFSNMHEKDQKAVLALQVALRSNQSESVKKELAKLSSLIGCAESQEFCSWFVNVAEQLHSHILTFIENTKADQERIKKEAELLDEVEGILAEMESQAARRARRESFERRKKNTDSLQRELDQMEQQVKIAEDAMNRSKKVNQIVSDLSDEASRCLSLTRELEDLIPMGATAGRKWNTLKGLSVWMPRAMTSAEMTFSYIGPCPKACVTVSFALSGTSSVPCAASVDPLAFPKHKSRNGGKLKSVMPLFASRTSWLCEKMSREKADPTQIGAFLRRNGWDLCRIELTASELALLQRRYRATLSSSLSGEGLTHVLEVDFQSRTTSCKIRGSFLISDAYPFDALNTQLDVLEGETLLDELQQLLVKNAKPGFGYLSRTCDVISAYLR